MTRLRMLALSPVPEEGAGCRFRVAQYIPALEAAGIDVTISPFFTREFFQLVYRKGHALRKSALFIERALARLRTVMSRAHYDIILVYREAFPIGPAIIETLLARRRGVAMVYDFDDAVYLPNTSDANQAISLLKWPRKVPAIIRRCDAVIAGNEYLADYARRYSDRVCVIPTCVDTTKFVPRPAPPAPPAQPALPDPPVPVLGWIGTPTTAPYLVSLRPILQELARAHPFVLRVCGAGADLQIPGVTVANTPWTLDGEVALFNTCDIGVYPLTDDEWAKGKCGFKAIQFMACAVPVVVAAVGVNRDIILDGENGFTAATPREWVAKLERLLSDPVLRARLGQAGRQTVEERYSLDANAPRFVSAIRDAVDRAQRRGSMTRSRPRRHDELAADDFTDDGDVSRPIQ